MLNMLRTRAQSTLIQAMVLLIAVVFVFWGVGANMNKNRNSLAVVNGEEIPLQDYQRAYDRAVENYRQQFGGRLPSALLKQLNLKAQVVGQLVQAELLRQGAQKLGLVVSNEATQREIQKMKAFQQNGIFDLDRYKDVLRQNRLTPTSFEEGIRHDLLTRHVIETIGSFAVLPPSELKQWRAFSEEEIQCVVRSLKSTDFEDQVEVKDAEVSTWFAKHKAEYTTESKRRLRYLWFSFAKDAEQIQLTDDELKARYESDMAKYKIPEQRHARHILFKVGKEASKEEVAQKKELAEKVLALARKGEDFAKLAAQYSEGPTRERGGDLGFFSQGRMVKAFDQAVFSLQAGAVSDLVRTPFGFHIIKLEEVRPAKTRSFAEVKEELAQSLKKEAAKSVTFKKASEAYENIMRVGSLDKYAAQGGKAVVKTDYFARSHPPTGITTDGGFLDAAFALGKGELSSLVELGKGYALIFVDDVQAPVVPKLDAVRDRVVADYRKEQAIELARAAADTALKEAKKDGALAGDALKKTDFVKRTDAAAAGVPPEVLADAFSLAPADHFPAHPVGVGNVFYLYEVRARRVPEDALSGDKKKQVEQQLTASMQNRLVSDWLSAFREKSEIWTNDTMLQ